MYTEIVKIIEGGLVNDKEKVINYSTVLAKNLEDQGQKALAQKIRSVLLKRKGTFTSLDSFATKPVDSESRMDIVEVSSQKIEESQVILNKYSYQAIDNFVESYKRRDDLLKYGLDVPNSLLLYGPPGCGKTTVAKYISSITELPLVTARLDGLVSSLLGSTAKNIRKIFDYAAKRECILFLDEFDAIAKARDDNNELGELKRVVNSLLQNIDTMSNDSLILAATNHQQLLDLAIWRRFDYKLEIELPDKTAIAELITLFSNDIYKFNQKEILEISTLFDGQSGSDIEDIMTKAIRNSVIHNSSFNLSSIYEEMFIAQNIIPQNCEDSREQLKIKAKYLREKDSKIFSLQTIADILGSSKTTIQKMVKEV